MDSMFFLLFVVLCSSLQAATSPAYEDEESIQYNHYRSIQNQSFIRANIAQDGSYEQLIFSLGGFVGIQRTARHEGEFLRLLELTDGASTVELIFVSDNDLASCDVTNSNRIIQRISKHAHKKYESDNFQNTTMDNVDTMLDIAVWQDKCTKLYEKEFVEGIAGNTNESSSRPKRGIMDLIWPGTKWCGKGNKSRSYYDLGSKQRTDKCCRDHDHCNDVIVPLSSKYNYFNYGLLTISSCDCDYGFKQCLRNAQYWEDDSIAEMIGHIYFNVMGMQCFDKRLQRVCKQSSWWGRCLRYGRDYSAVLSYSWF